MDNPSPTALFVVVNRRDGAILHAELKAKGWLNAEVEPMEVGEDSIGFPLLVKDDSTQEHVLDQLTVSVLPARRGFAEVAGRPSPPIA